MSATLKQHLLRYILGGATTTVLTWSSVWLFVEVLQWHYLLSTNAATLIAYCYSYLVNKVFVFGDRSGDHVLKGSKFLVLQIALLGFANAFMVTSVSVLGFHYMPSVIAVSVLAALINFTVMRMAIFQADSPSRTG